MMYLIIKGILGALLGTFFIGIIFLDSTRLNKHPNLICTSECGDTYYVSNYKVYNDHIVDKNQQMFRINQCNELIK